MATCEDCKSSHPLDNVIAHFGWCKWAGGPGYHPRSWQGLQDEYYRGLEAQARRDAEAAAAAAAEKERLASNNGWVRYPRHLQSVPDVTTVERPAFLEAERHHTEDKQRAGGGYLAQKPGSEIPREYRDLIQPLLTEHGWKYFKHNTNGKGKPRVVTPDGQTYTLAKTPSDYRGLNNTRARLRQLGAAI